MKIKDIRAKKPEALAKDEVQMRKELMSLRAQVAMGTTPKSTKQIKTIRKTLARIKTVRSQAGTSAEGLAGVVEETAKETTKESPNTTSKESPKETVTETKKSLPKDADAKNEKPAEK